MIPADDKTPDDEWDEEPTAPDDADSPDWAGALADALDDEEPEPELGDFWFDSDDEI